MTMDFSQNQPLLLWRLEWRKGYHPLSGPNVPSLQMSDCWLALVTRLPRILHHHLAVHTTTKTTKATTRNEAIGVEELLVVVVVLACHWSLDLRLQVQHRLHYRLHYR